MSLLPLIAGAARTGLAAKAPAAIGKLFGRKGRRRARAAARAPVAGPSLLERAVSLTGRLAGRPGVMPGMMPRRRRGRGISGAELRGFKKVARLLSAFGMRPRGLARPMGRRRSVFSARRVGDPFEEGMD